MPEYGVESLPHSAVMRYEEIAEVVGIAAEAAGITKVRITGGEPLVRPGVAELIRMVRSIRQIRDISMTSNGSLLGENAQLLVDAGLDRVNISLDTLKPERFKRISRVGNLEKVLSGIDAVIAAGLQPVKINAVVIRGFNDDEIVSMSNWALEKKLHLRFIEFMPVNDSSLPFVEKHISSEDVRERIFATFPDMKQCAVKGCGPAESWCRDGDSGSLGFIDAVSHSFCMGCNRLRLTSDGKIKPCLFSNDEVDLMPVLRGCSADRKALLAGLLRQAVMMKPESHDDFTRVNSESRCMHEVGG